jgi:hypothetical protein
MKQLPGRQSPQWIRLLLTGVVTAIATVWVLALLPFLLLMALIVAILLIPVLHRLRRDIQEMESGTSPPRAAHDVTPWHRQLINLWRSPAARPSGRGWGSAEGRGPGRSRD